MSFNNEPCAIDFHVHTSFSFDSLTPPKKVIETARRRGLNGIAVTDHNTVKGALAAIEANRHDDFFIIPGIEIKSDVGDIIALYVTEEIESRRFGDVIGEIHEKGGLAYLPHPIRTFGANDSPEVHRLNPEIDVWELYNGRYDGKDFDAARSLFETLAISHALSGSDAHFPWEVGLIRTLLSARPYDAKSLLELSLGATHDAPVREEVPRRIGITLGSLIKAYKRGNYGYIARELSTLPWKAVRRSLRATHR
ncbi:MAG: PHP domain-containing protein [Candidatus Eremiobacteraeota bacterium]|nr:PHP domain-containing protein [Candidatus Eremiobacteraeota bacterium]